MQVTYLGKRGGFMQLVTLPSLEAALPDEYALLTDMQSQFPLQGTLQILDDCAPSMTFDKANIYNHDSKVAMDSGVAMHGDARTSDPFALLAC